MWEIQNWKNTKRKSRKLIGIEDYGVDAAAITNIWNELIWRSFYVLGLLNVAGTCKRLQAVATAKYEQKFINFIILHERGDSLQNVLELIRNGYALRI